MAKKRKKGPGARRATNVVVPRTTVRAALRRNIEIPKFSQLPIISQVKTVRAALRLRTLLHAKQVFRARPTRALPLTHVGPIRQVLKPVKTHSLTPSPCQTRSIRVRVLHAIAKTGSGLPKQKKPVYTDNSKVKC